MGDVIHLHPNGEPHFGCCPKCGDQDGYINVGRGQWFYCRTHRVKWFAGENLFSGWRDESEVEQRAAYEALDFGNYRQVA